MTKKRSILISNYLKNVPGITTSLLAVSFTVYILKNKHQFFFTVPNRTKWKRQTQVGLELLAEAGNYAAVQRMLQGHPYWGPYMSHAVRPLGGGGGATDPSAFLRYGVPPGPRTPPGGVGMFVPPPGLLPGFPMPSGAQ